MIRQEGDRRNERRREAGKSVITKRKKARTRKPRPKTKKEQKNKMAKSSASLLFPGTSKKGHPVFYGDSTVYIDTTAKCWRLKKKSGDRLCTHFYFKKHDPKAVWKEIVIELRRLNR